MTYLSELTARGALAIWMLEDAAASATAADSSGNGRTGTYVGSPTLGAPGIIPTTPAATSMDADGTSDYVEIADAAWMDTSSISVVGRVKFDNVASASEVLFGRWPATSTLRTFLFQRVSTGELKLDWYDSGGTSRIATAVTDLLPGVEYTVGFTIDSVGVGTIYLDGVADGSLDPAGSLGVRAASTNLMRLGAHTNGAASLFVDGKMQGWAYFGTGLTASDHAEIHRAAIGGYSLQFIDALGLTDAAVRSLSHQRNQIDSLGLTDPNLVQLSGLLVHDQTDNLGLTDAATVVKGQRGIFSDNLGLTDSVSVVTAPRGDSKANPLILGGTYGSIALDLDEATLEVGESAPATVIGTVWLEYTTSDVNGVGTRFTSTNPDVTVRIYDTNGTTLLFSQDDSNLPDLTVPTDETGHVYLIQLGIRAGNNTIVDFSWFDASPQTYEDPVEAVQINGIYGSEDISLVNSTEAWVSWVAPTTTTVIFHVVAAPDTASFTVGGYQSDTTTLIDDSSGVGSVDLQLNVVSGNTYYLKFTSPSDLVSFSFTYNILPVIVSPADEYKTFIVEVYMPDGVTKITELKKRHGLNFQEPLNEPGNGTLTVKGNDPIMEAYPELFDWQNVVKIWLGNNCVHAFRIRRRRRIYVTSDEYKGWLRVISGPSVHHMLDDFIVRHDGLMTDRSLDVRNFGWMSMVGEWYNVNEWDEPYNSNTQTNPPGLPGEAAADRAKFGNPPNWPDPDSDWMWMTAFPDQNEGNFDPPPMKGKRYFRKSFTVTDSAIVARLYCTADEVYRVYIDGELVLEGDGRETGYTELQKKKVILRKGEHTIAVFNRSRGQTIAGDGSDGFMCTLMKLNKKGKPVDVLAHSGPNWRTTYKRPVPAWNRAQVLRAIVQEAQARGNSGATKLDIEFAAGTDTVGRPWVDRFNDEIPIGTSALEVQSRLSEDGNFDVWVDPQNFKLKAWIRRGEDKSASIALEPGRNLLNWEVEEIDEVKNDFLIQYDGGWTRYVAKGSRDNFGDREAFVTMGYAKEDEDAENVIKKASNGIAWAIDRAGTGDLVKRKDTDPQGGLIAVQGARPFLDFGVGDTIMAPNQRGIMAPHRVLMLTATEDDQGRTTYDPEMEEVR